MVVSRDAKFDESTFGFSPPDSEEVVKDLDFDSLKLTDDDPRFIEYKRKSRLVDEDEAADKPSTVRQWPVLEKESTPNNYSSPSEEEKEYRKLTSLVLWRASANDIRAAANLLEPLTFDVAVRGPDQVHCRMAICAEIESMLLCGVFRAAKFSNGQRTIGTKWVIKIKCKANGFIEKHQACLVAKCFVRSMVSTVQRRLHPWSSM